MYKALVYCCWSLMLIRNSVAEDFNTTTPIRPIHSEPSEGPRKQGWTPQPDGRGTMDILWSCTITMFLCSWSLLCMNMPGPRETRAQILWRKFSLTILGFLCPEILFAIAFSQWLSARHSVQTISSHNYGKGSTKWTMKEAFFADMGGFVLHSADQPPFPLEAQALLYLVAKGHIKLPELDHREIQEKNKADGMLRFITLCQIIWFLVNTTGRWAQHIVVTTAELTTVSFILCSLGIAFFWWHKPADAVLGKLIVTDLSINDILKTEGQMPDTWKRTPLDFLSRKEWWWSRCWANFLNILRHMKISFGSVVKPSDRIQDSTPKKLSNKYMYTTVGLAFGYFSVLFVGWDYSFPTVTEQLLWRLACVMMMVTLSALAIVARLVDTFPASPCHAVGSGSASGHSQPKCLESGCRLKRPARLGHMAKRVGDALNRVRNNSVDKDPELYVPLKIILPIYAIAGLYLLARMYILVADVIELRLLPASAYSTVNWQKYWPRLG